MLHALRLILAAASLFALGALAASSQLPWPDAAPTPSALPEDFAKAVMPPVIVTLPGMGSVKYTRNLRYTDVNDPNVLMDIYQPAAAREGAHAPIVFFIHGGTDTRAQPKDWGLYQSWGRLAAASGMVGVTFTHRLGFPKTKVVEGATDVKAAIGYVTSNAAKFGADPKRICLAAYSAGGPMLAPYMVNTADNVRCLVGYYPFMDIRQTEHHRASETAETREAYSSILRVTKSGRKTPLFLVRAGRDEIPTLLDSVDRFIAAGIAADYPLTVANLPGAPHGFDNASAQDPRAREVILETLWYLRYHLEVKADSL